MRIFCHLLLGSLLWTACSKEDLLPQKLSSISASVNVTDPKTSSVYASPWEEPGNWAVKDSSGFKVFSYQRTMPELTEAIVNKGAVLVWAKDLVDPTIGLMDKPMLTPFYFFPDNERPKYTEYWYPTTSIGAVNLSFRTTDSEENQNPNNKVKLRFMVIPQEVLQKNKLTAKDVYRLSYTQVINMLGVSA